jgi:hypothetical protein
MPAASFHEYARNLSDHLHETLRWGQAETLTLEVDQRSVTRGQISSLLTFEDQSELHFREYVDYVPSTQEGEWGKESSSYWMTETL